MCCLLICTDLYSCYVYSLMPSCVLMSIDVSADVLMCTDLYWCLPMYSCAVMCTDVYWCALTSTDAAWCVLLWPHLYWCVLVCTDEYWCAFICTVVFRHVPMCTDVYDLFSVVLSRSDVGLLFVARKHANANTYEDKDKHYQQQTHLCARTQQQQQ